MTVLEAKCAASIHGSLWLLCSLTFVFQETWGIVGDGGGYSKIWQIAENCLHAVIPVWTHLAHLVVIWQQKCCGGGLGSQSGATYYPHSSPPPPLFWFGLHTYCPLLFLWGTWSWWCCVVMLGSCPGGASLSTSLTLRVSVGCNWGVCRDERSTMMLQACIFSKRKAAHNVWTLNKANKSTDVINYPCLELFRTYASCSMVVHNNQQRSFRFFLTSNISVACVAESLVSVCRCSFY